MCCAPQQANHLDSSDEEDPFERIEDMNDIYEPESTEEEETVRILEQELARLRSENEFRKQHENTMTALVVILVIVLYAILIFGPRPCSSSPAEMAECPKISPCPSVSQCDESNKCEQRLCPDEQRVRRVLMRFEDDLLPKGFQVKDRAVTQIEEWTLARPALEVGHELVFVDGVNVEAETDDEISAMIWTSGALIHTNLIVRNSTSRIDYTKEICFLMELGTVLFIVFCFIVNVFEKAVWARDKKTMVDNKKHSLGENNAESHKIVDLGEIASETINAQNVAIEDNRVELEINADLGMMYMQMNNPGKPRQLKDTPEQRDNLLSALRHCHIGLHSETPHFYYGGDVSEGELWRIHPDDDYEFIAKVREEIAYCGDRKALRTEIERVQGQYKEPEHMSRIDYLEGILDKLRAENDKVFMQCDATEAVNRLGDTPEKESRSEYLEIEIAKARIEKERLREECRRKETKDEL